MQDIMQRPAFTIETLDECRLTDMNTLFGLFMYVDDNFDIKSPSNDPADVLHDYLLHLIDLF